MSYLGIDASKARLDCMLLDSTSGKGKAKSIPNTNAGCKLLLEWLAKHKAPNPHGVMEPTGVYHESIEFSISPDEVKKSVAQSIVFLQAQLKQLEQMINDHIDGDPDLRSKKDLLNT